MNKTQLTPTVELSVLADGLQAEKMYLDPVGTLFFPDLSQERIVGMNIGDKSRVVIPTDKVGHLKALGFFEKHIYGVSSQGVAEISSDAERTKIVIEPDELWGEITNVESYAGNIYLLDKGTSEIWKYPVIVEGFGDRRRWLGPGITLDLSKVSSFRVTGDVWITTESGKLERYSRGAPVDFATEGFPAVGTDGKLSDPVALFVTDDKVYVVEQGAKRVVVFGQDGKYQAQYENEEFAKASDIAVYKNKGYVLVGNVVKEFAL